MTTTTSPAPPHPHNAAPTASAWNRDQSSAPRLANPSAHLNGSHPLPGNPHINGGGAPVNGAAPVAVGHSRKGSIMVGGDMDIKRGNLAFGTVDSSNGMLSSSPAAPSITGSHLADAVKAFGSVPADSADPDALKPPSRKPSNLASTVSPPPGQPAKKQPDIHAMFAGKPGQSMERRQSSGQNGQSMAPNGQGMGQPGPQFHQGQSQYRPTPSGMPNYNPFRPSPMQNPMARPGGGQASMMGYGSPQGQYMNYPGQQNFYPGYYPGQPPQQPQQPPSQQQQQQYGMPPQQWAPPNMAMSSPRGPIPQVQSPGPHPTGLPNGAAASPVMAPQMRPPTLSPHNGPSTPSRSMQPGAAFTPGASSFTPGANSFSMSGGASSFTPRQSKAIKIARPDGTEVDIKSVAVKPAVPATEEAAPVASPAASSTPAKKPYSLPVVVRLESEEQKAQRLKEEAAKEKIRAIEAQEEKERKERKERQAKEAEEKKAAEEKAKAQKEEEEAAAKKAEEEAAAKKAEEDAAREEKEKADKEAADKAAEAKQAETPAPSTPAPSSPSTATAGLPAKPVDVEVSSPAMTDRTEASQTNLSIARPIEDLSSISYPNAIQPPVSGFNDNAEPGKFRYDRDFLMQFMQLCKEKPEGLPALEDIGLEADTTSGFGTRGGRGGRAAAARGGPAGLGIGGIGRPVAQGMGAFGMGNFGSVRGTTSEQRYQNSLNQPRAPQGVRVPSSGGPHGLPAMAPSMSSRGGERRSGRGGPRQGRPPPPSFAQEPEVAPLAISQNSWVKARPTDKDESSPAFVERKVKSLLNKLTQEKFDSISKQIVEWANRSKNETDGMSLKLVIKQVFEKATDEAHWSEMYGRLCRTLLDDLDPEVTEVIDDKPLSGGVLFRKYLIGRCQMDFEAGWKARELAVTAAAAKSQEDKDRLAKNEADKEEGKETEAAMLSDEYYAAQKAKRRGLGLVQLVGELYKLEMISTKVIKTCLQTLLANVTDPDEEDIESTCKLLTTVGGQFEAQVPENMTPVMTRLNAILNLEGTSSRLRFMIMDIMDLQKHHWKSKKTQSSVMTIAQIHQQAAKEQAAKAAHAAQSTRESMSRGGSRAGRQRNDEWQNVQQPARLPQRPADMSNLGKISTSQTAPTFAGPSSVFSKRGKPAVATPPLSRQTSTANMFSALNDAAEPAAEAAPERKRLVLQPRSVPAPGEEADEAEAGEVEEGEEEEEEAEEAPKSSAGMSEEAAKTKVASDMKELWGEKDQGGSRNPDDIVEYFKALPEERQPLLSAQLIDEAFRLSKLKDADIIARGLKLSLEQNAATVEVLKKGIENHMVSLDDDAIDFPQAYKAIALFIRSLSLPDADITDLLSKVEVYGEPKITPTDKLNKALAAVDEEAKASA